MQASTRLRVVRAFQQENDDPMIGQRIEERYTITEILGEGGMGIVYGAIHDDLDRPVAIKVVKHAGLSREAIERFRRETLTLSALGHPNIVAIYDVGRLDDGRPYMVMPRLRGQDLGAQLEDGAEFTPLDLVRLLEGPARALDLMHARGLVHRDLKPDNLIVERLDDGQTVVKLVDFGLVATMSRRERRLTREGFVSGTPEYVPPESVHGDVADGRGDVYSLAVVIFELLTGRIPFQSSHVHEILLMKSREGAPTLESVGYSASAAVEAVIAKGLARDPNDRYEKASGLIDALREAASEEPVAAPIALVVPRVARRRSGVSAYIPNASDAPTPAEGTIEASIPPQAAHAPRMVRGFGALAMLAMLGLIAVLLATLEWSSPPVAPTPVAPSEPVPSSELPLPEPTLVAPVVEREAILDELIAVEDVAPLAPRQRVHAPPPVNREPAPRRAAPAIPLATTETPEVDHAGAQRLTDEGTRALLSGRVPMAVDLFQQATLSAPSHGPAWRGLGLAYERLGRPADARRAYERYLRVARSAPDADAIRQRLATLGE